MSSKKLALNLIIDAESGTFVAELKKAETQIKRFDKEVEKSGKASKGAGGKISKLGSVLTKLNFASVADAVAQFASQVYDGINVMQGFQSQLSASTGSMDSASVALDKLTDFASETPFTIEQSVEAFAKLTEEGLNPGEEAMKSYGNIAAATGKDIADVAATVADATSGQLEGLEAFGIQAKAQGDSIAMTFQGQTQTISNNAADIESYLQSIGNNQFAGAMGEQMQVLSNKTANIGIEFNKFSKIIGDQGVTAVLGLVFDTIGDVIGATTDWLSESGILTDVIIIGGGMIYDSFNSILVELNLLKLGFLYVGQAATSVMAKSADASAKLLNIALKPLLNIIGTIADGWSSIFRGVAKFTGSEVMSAAADALDGFSESVDGFEISGDDIVKLNESIGKSIQETKGDIDSLRDANGFEIVEKWTKKNVKALNNQEQAANDAAQATERAARSGEKVKNQPEPEDETPKPKVEDLDVEFLTNQLKDYGVAWKSVGHTIIDTIGSMGSQFASFYQQHLDYKQTLSDIADKRIEIEKSTALSAEERESELKKLSELEAEVTAKNYHDKLSAMGSLAGAASQLFDEQSKERKALHQLEVAFATAESILTMDQIVLKATESVANAGTKGDPISAPVRVAAMAALMAGVLGSVGIAFGGGQKNVNVSEERQKSQGTGTVLGSDDKSQSILNSSERIEELELDQYAELRKMNGSLKALNRNITRLATSLVGGYGRFDESSYKGELGEKSKGSNIVGALVGGLKKTKKTLVDSGIRIVGQTLGEIMTSGVVNAQAYYDIEVKKSSMLGLRKKYSYFTEYEDLNDQIQHEFALIFTDIGDSINEAVDMLGIQVAKGPVVKYREWVANTIGKEFNYDKEYLDEMGFEPKEINEKFAGLFSGFIGTVVGEVDRSLDDFIIDLPHISLKDLTGEEIEKELQAVFSQQADKMVEYLVPSVKEFQKVGEGLYETLIRIAQEQVVFNHQLDAMGLSLSRFGDVTKETQLEIGQSIIELVGGIEEFQEQTGTYFSEFFSEQEQMAQLTKQIKAQFASLDTPMPKSREQFRALVESLDLTTESGQKTFAALMKLVPAVDKYYSAEEARAEKIKEMNDDLAEEIARMDMSALQSSLADIEKWRQSAVDAAKELGVTDFSMIDKLTGKKYSDLLKAEIDEINAEFEQLTDSIRTTSTGISSSILELRKATKGFDTLGYHRNQVNDLRKELGKGSISEQLENINQINTALNERYQAELEALSAAKELADERYEAELEAYETQLDSVQALNEAAKSLKEAAKEMLIGELSPLTAGEQFKQAEKQFNQLLTKAMSGDVDALNKLQASGQQYLGLAQQYRPGDYKAIFDQVYGAFEQAGNLVAEEPVAPSPHRDTIKYQEAAERLAMDTIAELEKLQELTEKLNTQATEKRDNAIQSVKVEITKSVEKTGANIVDAINNLPQKLPQPESNDDIRAGLIAVKGELERLNRNVADNRNEWLVQRRVV